MAKNEQVRIDLTADDKASKVIDKVADEAERLEKLDPEVEVSADTRAADRALDDVRDAAKELARVDAEIVARARVDDARADLKRLQADIRDTADTARAELDDLGAGAGVGGDNLARVADEGGRARSAMANMTGNAASELGELGAAGGLAAQSIGELAEAAAEGELSLGQLAKVAGPMLALGAAMAVLDSAMQAAQESKAFDADRVKRYTEALRDGQGQIDAMTDRIRELNQVQFRDTSGGGLLGLFSSTKDLIPVLRNAKLELGEFRGIIEHFGDQTQKQWIQSLRDAGVSTSDAIDIIRAAKGEYDAWNTAVTQAAESFVFLAGGLEQATTFIGAVTRGIGESITGAADWAAGVRDAAAANKTAEDRTRDLRNELDRLQDKFDDLRASLDYEQALDAFHDAIGTAMEHAQTEAGITNDDILAIQGTILDLADIAKTNPAVVESQLKEVTPDNLAAVAWNTGKYYANNPVGIATKLLPPPRSAGIGLGGEGVIPKSAPPVDGAAPTVVNVTQMIPTGYRGDTVAAAHQVARRAGTLYRRVGRR